MGLRNSPQTFQKLMDSVLAGMSGVFCYMDDCLVYTKDRDSHLKTVEELFKRLSDNGLAVHLDKCEFSKPSIQFLGYQVDGDGVAPLPKKITAISNFPPPFSGVGLGWSERVITSRFRHVHISASMSF